MPQPTRPDRATPRQRKGGPWKHGAIPTIGLVGGIGSGKSAAARAFEACDAFVIDADAVGHALLDQTPARERVEERFGRDLIVPGEGPDDPPRVDRKALAAIVFQDKNALRDLEAILHPAMRHTFTKAIARAVRRGRHASVVLDAAILYEAEWDGLCDLVVFVEAPDEVRLARLEASRGWTAETLTDRERAQWKVNRKRDKAGYVLNNDAGPAELAERVEALARAIVGQVPRRQKPASPPAAGPPTD